MAVGLGDRLYDLMVIHESSSRLKSFLGCASVASLLEATTGSLGSWKIAEEKIHVNLIIDFT